MAIRPVDMQVMLQRAPEVNRLTNNDGSRAETQQNQFAQHFQRVRDAEQKQVVQTTEAEGRNIDPDGSAGKEKQQRGRKKTNNEKDDEEKKSNVGRGMLDIMM
ncbi:MAG: hypothetical protein LBE35_08045 [Clostridiales bacterium]|jgi:hypothetical protein|nr:hypothetical protein [Clostridiales bacterium]